MTSNTSDLIAELRGFAAGSDSARATLMRDAANALTEVSAERDSFRRQAEHFAMRGNIAEADRDRLHKAITEALELHQAKKIWESDRAYTLICSHCELRAYPCESARILRAALDKEGNDDE